jgi:transcriptional regulator with XRE-family HTH domain
MMSSQEQRDDLERQRWKQFGTWLRDLRVDQARTQTNVAAAAGMGIQSLASLERGGFRRNDDGPWLVPNPKDETLISLARALRVDPEELFRRVGRYQDRPATKGSRRRQDRGGDRLAELEVRLEALEREFVAMRERNAETERRLRDAGIPVPDEAPGRPSRRRRAPG